MASREGQPAGFIAGPRLSPDGTSVLATIFKSELGSGLYDLGIISLPSGRLRRLTRSGDYYYAAWSPGGRTLLALRDPAYLPGYPPGEQPDKLSVIDAVSGHETPLAEAASAPEWAADGRSVVFSRFLLNGRQVNLAAVSHQRGITPKNLRRQFWGVAVAGGTAEPLTDAEVDRRLGGGYRAALSVCQRQDSDAYYPSSLYASNQPTEFLNSPRRGLTAFLGGVVTADGREMLSSGFHELPGEYAWSRLFLVGRRGVVRHIDYHDNLSLLRWSGDGRYVYGVGEDSTGRHLVAVDSRTDRLRQCLGGPQWEERAILDFLPSSSKVARLRLRPGSRSAP